MSKVGELIKTGTTEVKIRALYCFASLIAHDKDPTVSSSGSVDHRVILMTREWFRSLSSRPSSMEVLNGICKNPFPDIKLAGLTLLDAICQYHWGEELVAQSPGSYLCIHLFSYFFKTIHFSSLYILNML